MAMDVSTLSVRVESKGIDTTTKSLEGLEKRAGTTEAAVMSLMDKLGKSSASVLSVVQSMNQLRAAMQGALPNNAISASLSDFKKMSDEIKNIQSMMGKGVGGNISVTIKDIGSSSKEAVKGVESLNQSLSSGQNVMQAFGKELYHIRNLLGGTMLAGALINTAQSAIKMADAWTLMGAKLKIQVGSQLAASMAQEQLYNTAQKLRIPMGDMVVLFNRLVPAMKEYGYSVSDAMSVTTTMAAALKVSGATAAEASSVMLQFSQAMQSGRLNGAEFNAIAEGAPIILRLIGQEINKTRGELKKLGADGVLGIEVITEALMKNEKALVGMAKSVPDTVESSFTNLKNALTKYIGEANNAIGITGLIASAIKSLAENLDTTASIVKYTLIAAITGYTASVIASNVASANAILLSNSLAASMGITAAASTTAAGGVTLFTRALDLLSRHPIIAVLSVIAAGAAYLYDKFQEAANGAKSFENKLNEIDKMKAPEGLTAYSLLIEEVLTSLQKENNKLTELTEKRKKAYKFTEIMSLNDAIETQTKLVHDLAIKYGIAAQRKADLYSGETVKRVNDEVKSLQEEGKWLDYQISMGGKLSETEKKIFEKRQEISKASEGLYKQSLIASLAELEANLKREKALDAMSKTAKKATSEQESAAKKLEKQYLSSLNSAQSFIDKQEEELGLKRKLTDAEQKYVELMRVVSDIEGKFKGKDTGELRSLAEKIKLQGEQAIVQQKLNESMDDYFKKLTQTMEAEDSFAEASFKSAEAQRQKLLTVQRQLSGTTQTPLGDALDSSEADQRRIDFINKQISATQKLIEETLTLEYTKAISSGDTKQQERIWALMEVRQKYIDNLKLEKHNIEDNAKSLDKYYEELFKLSQITMAEIGRSPGQILADGFGEAGSAIGKMMDSYEEFGKTSAAINKNLADQIAAIKVVGGKDQENQIVKAEKQAADKRLQITAQMFGTMAGQAKGFFNEHSKGYAIMEKAEKAFRALELALAIKSFVQKMFFTNEETTATVVGERIKQESTIASTAVYVAQNAIKALSFAKAAIAGAFVGVPPYNFITGAAMIAIMAGLGFAVAGATSGGGGTGGVGSATRQEEQGKGTVFGDTSAKSESASKALETVANNSSISLKYNEGMLNALKSIESSITGVTKTVLRQDVQAQVKFVPGMFDKNTNFDLGGLLFHVKKSVVDSGIVQFSQSMKDIIDGAMLNVTGYAEVETKRKKWGKTTTSSEMELQTLDDTVAKQLTEVVKNMGTSIKESAKALGMDGQAFTDRLNNFVVDIGAISLHDLSAEDLQKTLTNVFSKLGDQMATAALANLDEFQKVGEGYFETLTRVASTVATVDGIFHQIGQTFSTTGLEAVKAKMNLVDLAGGLENLNSLVSGFFDKFYTESEKKSILVNNLNEEFKKLGITTLDLSKASTRIDFRDAVNYFKGIDSEKYVALLKLAPDVDKVVEGFVNNVDDSSKALAKQLELKDKLAILEGKGKEVEARKRQEELGAMDDTSKAIQLRIWELEDEKVAIEAAKEVAAAAKNDEISSLNQQISVQQDYVSSLKTSTDGINNLIGNIDSLASSGMAMLGMTPKVKSLVENFNSTDESVRSLSETLNKFTATTVLSLSDRLTNLVEQDKAILDFQSNLKDMIGNLRFESLSLEDRISSLKTLEGKLFGEINGADNPLEVAKHLQEVITQRYSLEQEYQTGLLAGQKEINETTKSNLKQQIDSLHSTKDFLTSLKAFTASLKIGELSILSPEKQLGEASQQFYETLAKAKTGDTQAQADLTNLAKSLLDEAKGFYASTTGYVDVYNQVTSALDSFGDMANIDPQITLLEKQLSTLDALAATTDSLKEQQIADLERVSDTLNNAHIDNKAKQQELIDALKVQISELKTVQENQIAQIKQQLAIRDESNIKLDEANGKLSSMRDSLKLLERK